MTGKDGQTGTPVAIATQLPPNVSAAFSIQQQPFQVLFSMDFKILVFSSQMTIILMILIFAQSDLVIESEVCFFPPTPSPPTPPQPVPSHFRKK